MFSWFSSSCYFVLDCRSLEDKQLVISHLFVSDLLSGPPYVRHHLKMTRLGLDSGLEDFSDWSRNREGNVYQFIPAGLFKELIVRSIVQKRRQRLRNANLPQVTQQSWISI